MQDLKYIIAAVVCAAGLLSLSYNVVLGVYISLGYLWFNALLMIMTHGIVANPDVFPIEKTKLELTYRNHTLQFLVHVITGFFLYALFIQGYVFHASFFAFMLAMSVVSNIFTAIIMKKE